MNRRKFAYYLTAGMFSLGERLSADTLDTLAAMVMQCVETKVDGEIQVDEHRWSYRESDTWRWFDRETNGEEGWELSGRTRPVNRMTGELAPFNEGYLDESLVPDELRFGSAATDDSTDDLEDYPDEDDYGEVSSTRRARHGRPPSKWLRSLYAEELRLWLPEIDVPPAGVSGMTVWNHLTRDHRFDGAKIKGLNEQELFKLHAAAHYGY